jgi:hypothetical protein
MYFDFGRNLVGRQLRAADPDDLVCRHRPRISLDHRAQRGLSGSLKWHNGNVPDRQRVPGFLTLERWTGADDPNVTLAIYDLQSVDVLQSPQYRAIGQGNPSPWTRRLLPKCERILRFVGEQISPGNVIAPQYAGGLLFMGFNILPGMEDEYARWMDEEHLPRLAKVPGVLCARRFVATDSSHKYIAVYHLTHPEVCGSPAWLEARETPWTHSIRPRTSERLRITCRAYQRTNTSSASQ